jgi:NADPH-dependent curcumin reductase CurA
MPNDSLESPTVSREVRLAARPVGEPTLSDFELVEVDVPPTGPGQVLVRNTWMSVDPYMRGRMDDEPSYMPPFELGTALQGSAVGEVVESDSEAVPVGATVLHFLGWRDHAVVDAADVTVLDVSAVAPQAFLGVLGMPGLTAYAALTDVAPVRPGDVVFVSSAAGAVGSIAGQIARQLGASSVVGSAGGALKAKLLLNTLGFDAAIDYKAGHLASQLSEAAPDGIDVYVDAVGGDHLQAAIDAMRVGGRIAVIGAIAEYNATAPVPGPTNLYEVAKRELTLRGMLVNSYLSQFPDYIARAVEWLAEGSLVAEETVVDGLAQAPQALLDVLRGGNVGKMLVRLS